MDSRDDSFLDDLADELVWGRLLAVDPALPECLGGTVILLGMMRPWCVKRGMPSRAGTGESASSPLKRGFQGLSIFKSLHNYHYGTFIIPAHSPTPNPERVQKHSQIATDESPSRVLGTLRLVWLLRHFLERNLLAICLWARFRVADAFSSKYLMRFACAHASADCSLTCFNLLSRPSLSTIPILNIDAGRNSGASLLQICMAALWRGKIHTPAPGQPPAMHLPPGRL